MVTLLNRIRSQIILNIVQHILHYTHTHTHTPVEGFFLFYFKKQIHTLRTERNSNIKVHYKLHLKVITIVGASYLEGTIETV